MTIFKKSFLRKEKQKTRPILKKGTRIRVPNTRAEKIYKDQEINGLKYNEGCLAFVEADNTLIYQFTDEEKVVFKNSKDYSVPNASYACDGLLIFFDKAIFHLSNYVQL